MRIAMIGAKGIPATLAQGGGIEAHVEELSKRLVARGHDVTVYVRPYANPQGAKQWNGIRLITLPTIRRKHLDAWIHTFLSSLHVLFQPVDIIHYHGVGPSTLAWIPRVFKWRAKVVVTFHSRDRFHEKWRWFARTYLAYGEWTAVHFPHATIATSHVIKTLCKKKFHRDVWYIPNGVEIPLLHPGTSELHHLGLKPDSYFFTLSRLVPHKAIEDGIQAFGMVETDKKLVIIGTATYDDIAYENKLKKLAAKDPRVVMAGRRTGKELEQLVANAYAMLHPSRSEGLSVAVLEAMSHAKLVIMSDIPENLQLVDHSGVSYPVGNVRALADAIRWALADPEMVKDRGTRARGVVARLYSWDSVLERVEAVYTSLV